jgi:hypothetical protein
VTLSGSGRSHLVKKKQLLGDGNFNNAKQLAGCCESGNKKVTFLGGYSKIIQFEYRTKGVFEEVSTFRTSSDIGVAELILNTNLG